MAGNIRNIFPRKEYQSIHIDDLLIEGTVTFRGDIVINTRDPNAKIIINGREITLEILDKLDQLDKLTEMVTAMWYAPGMPGANSIAAEVEDLDKKLFFLILISILHNQCMSPLRC